VQECTPLAARVVTTCARSLFGNGESGIHQCNVCSHRQADTLGFASRDGRMRPSLHKPLVRLYSAVFFQPLQFFANLDLAMPWVLAQSVAFAGENQEFVGDA
jgi:hypothetical protein